MLKRGAKRKLTTPLIQEKKSHGKDYHTIPRDLLQSISSHRETAKTLLENSELIIVQLRANNTQRIGRGFKNWDAYEYQMEVLHCSECSKCSTSELCKGCQSWKAHVTSCHNGDFGEVQVLSEVFQREAEADNPHSWLPDFFCPIRNFLQPLAHCYFAPGGLSSIKGYFV